MIVLFFGDSFTSGENNNFESFVDYLALPESIHIFKEGVSGSTVGDYSIYPVGDNSLISQLYRYAYMIESADLIFLEYGINDAASISLDYTTLRKVQLDIVKCIDYISQLNPKCKIIWLTLSFNIDALTEYMEKQTSYISSEYLSNFTLFNNLFGCTLKESYQRIIMTLHAKVPIISMIDNPDFWPMYVDTDGLHPNKAGYQLIADKLKEVIMKENTSND